MFKRALLALFIILAVFNLCGCFTIIAGELREMQKAKADLDVSYMQVFDAAKEGFKDMGLNLEKSGNDGKRAFLKGIYTGEDTISIEIFNKENNKSSIEVRVGTSEAGKIEAQKVLEAIKNKL